MQFDRILRWVAIATLPLALAALYWRRSDPLGASASPSGLPSASALPPPHAAAHGSARLATAAQRSAAAADLALPAAAAGSDAAARGLPSDRVERPRAPLRFAADLPDVPTDLGTFALPASPLPERGSGTAPPIDAARSAAAGSCGGLQIRGITASADPAWSFASIAPAFGGEAAVRHVGDAIGSYRVDAIEWDRVWLRGGSGRCMAALHQGVREARAAVGLDPNAPAALAAAAAPPIWQVPAEISLGIRRRSVTELALDPSAIERIFATAADLLAGTRLDPVREGDEVVGVELAAIAPDSLLDRLGLESGDIVRALDDQRVASLEGAVVSLAAARARRALVARVARGGAEFDLEVIESASGAD